MTRRALWGYLLSQAVSIAGTRLSMVAVPWLVLTTTGSATRTGLVAFAEMGPLVLAQVLSGPWIDRLGPRRVALVCDAGSVLAVAVIPVLHLLDLLTLPAVVVAVAIAGALRGPCEAAQHAMLPDLIAALGMATERITGLAGTIERVASMVGVALAGAVVAALGPANALLVDAGSFALAGVLLWTSTRGLRRVSQVTDGAPYVEQLRSGWSFMRRDPVLLGIGVMVAITNLIDLGYSSVLLPVWVRAGGHGVELIGVIGAVMTGGALAGSLVATVLGDRLPRFPVFVLGFLAAGAPRYLVLAMEAPLSVVLLVMAVAGFGSGFLNPILGAVIFERIPAPLVGRVTSMNLAMSWSLMPFGGLVAGLTVAGVGILPALGVFASAYLLTTLAPVVDPRWRDLGVRRRIGAQAE